MRNRKVHQKEKQYRRLVRLKNADMAQYNSVIGLNFFAYVNTLSIKLIFLLVQYRLIKYWKGD